MVTHEQQEKATGCQNSGKTLVIFRKWSNGDIIALFPLEPGDCNGVYCMSYEQIGQHGQAATDLPSTEPATPEEYASLARELRSIGYVLRIGKRVPRNAMNVRRAKLRAMR